MVLLLLKIFLYEKLNIKKNRRFRIKIMQCHNLNYIIISQNILFISTNLAFFTSLKVHQN